MRPHKRSNGDNAVLGRMRRSRLKKAKNCTSAKKAQNTPYLAFYPFYGSTVWTDSKNGQISPVLKPDFFGKSAKFSNFQKTRREQGRNTRPISNSPNGILARRAKRLYRRATHRKCATPARRSTALPPRASALLRDASRRRGQNQNLREF